MSLASSLGESSPSMSLAVPSWGLPAMISSLALLERSANGGGDFSLKDRGAPPGTLFSSSSSTHKKNAPGSPPLRARPPTPRHKQRETRRKSPAPRPPRHP